MNYTEFAVLDDEELISFTLTQANVSNLEIELAQRMGVLLDMVSEFQQEIEVEIFSTNNAIIEIDEIKANCQLELGRLYEKDPRSKSKRFS